MGYNINIANVSIKKSETDHELVGIMKFLRLPLMERNKLIMTRAVQFFDEKGESIRLSVAMASITTFIKELRQEGQLTSFMETKED